MSASRMQVFFWTWAVGCLSGCAQPEPAASPRDHEARDDRQIEREQRALEHRRLQLERQLLADLRQLRAGFQASAGPAELAEEQPAAPSDADELLVFGGVNHELLLGCLCDEQRTDSVFNMLGEHGSHSSPTSIRNKFAPFGSNHDDTSACSRSATHPPVVVAADGKALGLLSLNTSLKRTITTPSVAGWLARMCGE